MGLCTAGLAKKTQGEWGMGWLKAKRRWGGDTWPGPFPNPDPSESENLYERCILMHL